MSLTKSSKSLPKYLDDLPGFVGDLRSLLFPTQGKAAAYFNVSRSTITRYESGKHAPPQGYLAYLGYMLLERQANQDLVAHQQHLLKEINQALRYAYRDISFESWTELSAVAQAYLVEQKKQPNTIKATTKATTRQIVFEANQTAPPAILPPPEVDNFIGREIELTHFVQTLTADHFTVIVGMPGVGKTAVAVTLAKMWQAWQENSVLPEDLMIDQNYIQTCLSQQTPPHVNIFWHTFHHKEGIMSLIWKLAAFLAWHEQPDLWHLLESTRLSGGQLPPPTTLFDYLFQMLHGQTCLLCFDDIHLVDEDPLLTQFVDRCRKLVQEEAISLIITSRRVPPYLYTVNITPLIGLTLVDTKQLTLLRGLDLSPQSATDLYHHTEGNAQLLNLAIESLKRAKNIGRALAQLAEADNIERYLIAEVDQQLDEAEREVLIAIAVLFGYPGSREIIEIISQQRRLKSTLRQLRDHHLLTVQVQADEEVYSTHALLRAFYYDLPNRRELRQMHLTAAEYYTEEYQDALKAALHYQQAGEADQAVQLATSDLQTTINRGEAQTLLNLLADFKERQVKPENWVRLLFACSEIHKLFKQSETAHDSYQTLLTQLDNLPATATTQAIKVRAYLGLGALYLYQNPQQGLTWLQQGLTYVTEDMDLEAGALYIEMATIYLMLGDYESILDCVQEGLNRLPADLTLWHTRASIVLGLVSLRRGNLKEAREHNLQALKNAQYLHDDFRMSVIYCNLGLVEGHNGNWLQARDNFEQALKLAQKVGNQAGQVRLISNIGVMHFYSGDNQAALNCFEQGLKQAEMCQLEEQKIAYLISLADLYLIEGETDKADPLLKTAKKLLDDLEIKYLLPKFYISLATLYIQREQWEQALTTAQQSLQIAQGLNSPEDVGLARRMLGLVYLGTNKSQAAVAAFTESFKLLKEISPYEAARTQLSWGRYLITTENREEGIDLLQEAETTFARLGAKRELAIVQAIQHQDISL